MHHFRIQQFGAALILITAGASSFIFMLLPAMQPSTGTVFNCTSFVPVDVYNLPALSPVASKGNMHIRNLNGGGTGIYLEVSLKEENIVTT